MASSSSSLPLFFFLLIITSSVAKSSSRPKALLLKVTKDAESLQFVTQVSQGTPLVPVKLTLDLGGDYMWVNCERGYTSSSYIPASCGSPACKLLNKTYCCTGIAPGCYNNTCTQNPYNSVKQIFYPGRVGSDVVAIQSTNGKNALKIVTLPRLYFVCGNDFINFGLASGVIGMAGLGRTPTSLPDQLSSHFKFDPKFALCLSSSTKESGLVFFGNGSYMFLPNFDATSSLTYTPLIISPVSDGSDEYASRKYASRKYFIGVTSIKINDKHVGINKTLLSIDAEGYGGTTISTVDPYTVLESSIYNAVVAAFVKEMPKNVQRVPSVVPFGACFSSKNISSTQLGPGVPSIDLVLQSKNVYWRMFGANSMVEVGKDVLCLAFVEAPKYFRRFAVVIGGHQIEDNLLQFDLEKSRLGFSSSLLGRSTTCANFNFTSTA